MADVPAGAFGLQQRGLGAVGAGLLAHAAGIDHRRVHRSGADAVDADVVAAVIDRHRAGQADDRGLRGRVGRQPARAQRRDRGDVDDRAALGGLDHRGDRMLRKQEHGLDIDLHDSAILLGRLVDHAAAAADADIVVEEIEPAPAVEGGFDQRLAVASLVTSPPWAAAVPPSAAIISTVRSASLRSRSATSTFAPARASRIAAARPLPMPSPTAPPPLISATLPARPASSSGPCILFHPAAFCRLATACRGEKAGTPRRCH